MKIILLSFIVFFIALTMSMTGRGGGNFYVLTLALFGFSMHTAATTGQFILFITSLSSAVIFKKGKTVSFPLALLFGIFTSSMAFLGGFLSHIFSGTQLKIIFGILLSIAGIGMMFSPDKKSNISGNKLGFWKLKTGEEVFVVNLWVSIPIVMITGFFAGMVGVSGGSFLVPLMVLASGVPMKIAVGTSSVMVSATALFGFMGHLVNGHFDFYSAIPIAISAAIGGILGGKMALKTKSKYLKMIFAITTILASIVMFINAFYTK